jgi:predicted NBD/HSP70 family sugar kinase
MADGAAQAEPRIIGPHGARMLPDVEIISYNEEVRDAEGFVGDRASKKAFQAIIDDWRERLDKIDADPLGATPTAELSKRALDKALASGDIEAAALVHAAIEEFAQELTTVIRRFLRLKAWKGATRIAIGGGFRQSRVGELVVGRTSLLLKAESIEAELRPIAHHPDEAGLIGAIHLFPSWALAGHDSILAVDIGGTNIRAGIVDFDTRKNGARDGRITEFELWRHADDVPGRDQAVERLVGMLRKMIAKAKREKLRLAPFVGVGCPGIIEEDGTIERGGQNLPGKWESKSFNLPRALTKAIPKIDETETIVVMHNDAVVQGLSELPRMDDVENWGVLTIGTGLGNARFSRREKRR